MEKEQFQKYKAAQAKAITATKHLYLNLLDALIMRLLENSEQFDFYDPQYNEFT